MLKELTLVRSATHVQPIIVPNQLVFCWDDHLCFPAADGGAVRCFLQSCAAHRHHSQFWESVHIALDCTVLGCALPASSQLAPHRRPSNSPSVTAASCRQHGPQSWAFKDHAHQPLHKWVFHQSWKLGWLVCTEAKLLVLTTYHWLGVGETEKG